MRTGLIGVAFVLICAGVAPALAQLENLAPPPGCRAWNADLPKEWEPWGGSPAPLTAAVTPAGEKDAEVGIGKKLALTLAPAKTVTLEKSMPDIDFDGPKDPHSGLLSFHVPTDGLYWVAASGGVWIDIIVNGQIIDPRETDGGPLCASLGKALQYRLKAGDATIQLVRSRGPHVDLMVAAEP